MPRKFCKVLIVFGGLIVSLAPLLLQAQAPEMDGTSATPADATAAPAGNDPAASTKAQQPSAGLTVETLVCIRHGEKTTDEIGQLSVKGLNRSLALPTVLVSKFGKPGFIFAPDPAGMLAKKNIQVCYIRPLATIEPTAILLGLPVNTLFGYSQIDSLETELEKPDYANSVVFIAWEHNMLEKLVRQEMVAHGGDGTQVPSWNGNDFDAIYLLKLTRKSDGSTKVSFSLDHEGLDNLGKEFPVPVLTTGSSQPSSKEAH